MHSMATWIWCEATDQSRSVKPENGYLHLLRAQVSNYWIWRIFLEIDNICLLLSLFCSRFRVEAVLISEGALKIDQIIQPYLFVFVQESHFIRGCTKQKQTSAILGQFCPIFCQSPRTLTGREFFREAKERTQRCSVWIHSFKFKRSTSSSAIIGIKGSYLYCFFFQVFFSWSPCKGYMLY